MVRTLVMLGAVLALLSPIGCVREEDPRPFSTDDSCEAGDTMDCECDRDGSLLTGKRSCPSTGHFYDRACQCSAGGGGSK